MTSPTCHLELQDLTYSFPAFDFGPVSLRCAPGRVYGLLGANGAGKTTLLNLITQQLRPKSGSLRFGDMELQWDDRIWKSRLCYIREAPAFYEEFTVAQVLRFAARIYDRWDDEFAASLVRRLNLDTTKLVGALSKGTRVKLGLVAGLAADVNLMLLDEPTAGLDPTARAELQQTVRELVEEKREALCVILSSHIFEDLDAAADVIVVLHNGRVAFEATRDELQQLALFRCGEALDADPLDAAVLTWRAKNERWVVTAQDGPLAERLSRHPDCAKEQPRSMMEAVYHGVQRS